MLKVVGLVGGIASGKSSIAQEFCRLGAALVEADKLGHEVLMEDEVKQKLRDRWGDSIFLDDGAVNRQKVAAIVFARPPEGPQELRFLEGITHPRIARKIQQRIRELGRSGVQVVILDAPLLLEAGWASECQRIVYVHAPREERLRRAKLRGWSEAQLAARESAQLSLEEKRKVADEVIDNSSSFEHTLAQIQRFWQSL